MSLRTSRNRTYGPGDPVVSADLNDIQDGIIYLNKAHEERTEPVSCLEGLVLQGAIDTGNYFWYSTSTTQLHSLPLPLKEGDRIKSIVSTIYRNGANPMNLMVYKQTNTGASSLIGATWDDAAVSPTLTTVSQDTLDGTDYTVAAGEKLIFRIITGNAGDRLYKLAVTFDRPAA